MKWAMKPKSKKREVKKPEEKGWFFSLKETKVEEPPKSISTVTDGKDIHLKPSIWSLTIAHPKLQIIKLYYFDWAKDLYTTRPNFT